MSFLCDIALAMFDVDNLQQLGAQLSPTTSFEYVFWVSMLLFFCYRGVALSWTSVFTDAGMRRFVLYDCMTYIYSVKWRYESDRRGIMVVFI